MGFYLNQATAYTLYRDETVKPYFVDKTPEEAIEQIRKRRYAARFQARPGMAPRYTGRILAVGIACDRKSKKYRCKVEVLREAMV